jgi:hypothetical protein
MIKLLVSSVILVMLSYFGITHFGTSSSRVGTAAAQIQIDKSSQDINQAVDRETQRANALNQPPQDSQSSTP